MKYHVQYRAVAIDVAEEAILTTELWTWNRQEAEACAEVFREQSPPFDDVYLEARKVAVGEPFRLRRSLPVDEQIRRATLQGSS